MGTGIYYLMQLAAVVLLALQFCMNKLYQAKNGSGVMTSLLFTTLCGFGAALIFFLANGCRVSVTPFALICALGVAAMTTGYNLLGFKIFSMGNFSVYMMFLMLGGMMLPFIYGMIFLGEAEGASAVSLIARIAGLVLLTVSMALPCFGEAGKSSGTGKKSGNGVKALFIIMCICVFMMNGMNSVFSKIHTIASLPFTDVTFERVSDSSFVVLCNVFNGIFSLAALLVMMAVRKEKPQIAKDFSLWKLLLVVAGQAGFGGVAYFFMLIAAAKLPASVQYPIITGGTVVLTAIAGRIAFGEKQDRMAVTGTVLSFAATFLFLL